MQRLLSTVPTAGVLSFLLALVVTGCASLSTNIAERDESAKNIKLSPGQEVIVLMPKASDSEALESVVQKGGFNTQSFLEAIRQELIAQLTSRGVRAIAEQEQASNTLEIEVTGLKRKGKALGMFGETKAELRANITLVVAGNRREFESVTQQGTTETSVAGVTVASSEPVKGIVKTFATGIASRIVQ